MTKLCPACQVAKPLEEYQRSNSTRLKVQAYCRDCRLDSARASYRALRVRVLRHYGGDPPRCACCGESQFEFMSVDHVHGGGGKHRQALGMGGKNFLIWLERQGFPPGFQVLCHNCNQAKGYYGQCPHQLAG